MEAFDLGVNVREDMWAIASYATVGLEAGDGDSRVTADIMSRLNMVVVDTASFLSAGREKRLYDIFAKAAYEADKFFFVFLE
jgi:hypothetical protein